MSNHEILKFCIEKGFLLDKRILDFFNTNDSNVVKEILEKINIQCRQRVITKSFFCKNIETIKEIIPSLGDEGKRTVEKLFFNLGLGISLGVEREVRMKSGGVEEKGIMVEAEKEIEKQIYPFSKFVRIFSPSILPTKKLEVGDFTKCFRNRFSEMRKILQERGELNNLVSIGRINGRKQGISLIGMVTKKRVTKNKNFILQIEDLTGGINVLVNYNKSEIYEKAKEVMLDDVIGIRGTGTREIIFVNDIIFPDAILPKKKRLNRDESIAFISDMHIGSSMFLENNFLKFIDWINGVVGEPKQREQALKIKYLFIVGDTIDGVGVYPNQEEFLNIKNIKEQYVKLADMLSKIRKDIIIILCPGQHDAVRVAEPQPFITKEYGKALYELENLILVTNPCLVEIVDSDKKVNNKSFKILMYHGASLHGFVNEIEELRVSRARETPARIVKYILKKRHLAPTHSLVTYIPNAKEDPLLIKQVPDIITIGEVHRSDVDLYNNVLIICNSCWQSTTPFEEKVGNYPDPCKVPVFNLKTREIKIMDFS